MNSGGLGDRRRGWFSVVRFYRTTELIEKGMIEKGMIEKGMVEKGMVEKKFKKIFYADPRSRSGPWRPYPGGIDKILLVQIASVKF